MTLTAERVDFSLRHTLECGQFFRYRAEGDGYRVTSRDVTFTIRQDDDLHVEGADDSFVRHFFSLDHDLSAITASIDQDPFIHAALERYRGLRLIRQDPWECVAAFITSQVSNIPRITKNVEDMARVFGSNGRFPRPHELGSEAQLRKLRLGFRAKYLAAAARRWESPEALDRERLMEFEGIGAKVADCIRLFAFGDLEAFPVDTWIRKVMRKLYFRNRKVSDDRIRRFAAKHFGTFAGYAQQYLFVWSRAEGRRLKANG